jgi:two-component system NarL family sensor kinase
MERENNADHIVWNLFSNLRLRAFIAGVPVRHTSCKRAVISIFVFKFPSANNAKLRKLSARLMRVQDEERRRIAAELHDGLGQWLAAAQINVDMVLLRSGAKPSPMLEETRKLIDHAVTSIRTMSYLLHPPLLDEAGFEAAAHWFIEGFSKRTAMTIRTNFCHPEHCHEGASKNRMPEVVELALFRALQEGLTNAHRHSASPSVEVTYQRLPDLVILEIQDFGRGLPPSVMERVRRIGAGSGVGLAGIRERVK